ncbi:MAG TPA: MXAN_6640 family putative metalloprotease [Actinomycetes bacterium]|nr:MXAN_6640 family putative metalloprotease [Actinomycetes bacterium]
MSLRTRSRTTVSTVAIVAATTLLLPTTLTATADVSAPPAMHQVSAPKAKQALAVAEAVMSGQSDALSPTLALRDLALHQSALEGADRSAAEELLARPNEMSGSGDGFAAWGTHEAAASRNMEGCSADPSTPICIHWTNVGTHAPKQSDTDDDGVPNWVEVTLAEMEYTWTYETSTLNFREPMTDERGSKDNDGKYFDVYLSNIGSRWYGYCATDDTHNANNYDFKDRSGYCVLDDDYSSQQFPFHTPRENLQVTAAHEFFHAVQFAYDASEDAWFMEGAAAWIEDEVYDDVNDNRQYLAISQFRHPRRPLDSNQGLGVYGTWGFFRYLSDRFGTDVLLRAWQRADGSDGGPDDYSLVALRRAVQSQGADFDNVLGDFGMALAEPELYITEGDRFPKASVDTFTLGRKHDSTKWQRYTLDHLSFAPVVMRPGRRLRDADKVRISVDAPGRVKHPEARVMVVRDNGSFGPLRSVHLNRRGNGAITVDFGNRSVRRMILALGNTSTEFRRCFSHTTRYSCKGGIPLDENQKYWFKAVIR